MVLKAISVISVISLLLLSSSLAGSGALASTPQTTPLDEINGPGGLLSTSGVSIQSSNPGNPLEIKEHHPAHVKKFIGPASVTLTGGNAPATILSAYGFNTLGCDTTGNWTTDANLCGHGQTIAIVDAYNDPNIASDLSTFDSQFGLTACTVANGCFTEKIQGSPSTDSGWALEISLDVEWAHAIAPGAKIVLVESSDSSLGNLLAAVDTAVGTGAKQVSNSWGGNEFSTESNYDSHYNSATTSFFVSSGDGGHGVYWPAASPYVIAVGGTTLTTSSGNWASETAWTDSGGGISAYEPKPSYQNNFNTNSNRAVPDVSYDGNPNTGMYVYDSVPINHQSGWWTVGGTSAGAPQWAALSAIVNSKSANLASASFGTSNALYGAATGTQYAKNYHDITSGTNGNCGAVCTATVGYDEVTGLGSPQANNLVSTLTIPPSPDFTISANPSSFTVPSGTQQSSTITITSIGGFSGTVTLSSSAGSLGSASVNLPASGSVTTTLTFTPTTSGTYSVTGTSGTLVHSTSILVAISQPLTVSVTSSGTFTQGSTDTFTVGVTSNSTPISGASVTLKITTSTGGIAQGTGTTSTNGKVIFSYSISRNAPTGTYTASATATKSGYLSGSGSETFVVNAASVNNHAR